MQSNYDIAEILPDEQQFINSNCSPPLINFPPSNPSVQSHHYPLPPPPPPPHHQDHGHLLPHQLLHIQPVQQSSSHVPNRPLYPYTHQFFQQQYFQPWRYREQEPEIRGSSNHQQLPQLNFKLGLNENSSCIHGHRDLGTHGYYLQSNHSLDFMPKQCRQTQEYSTAKEPFWNSVASDTTNAENKNSRVDVREICKELESKYRLYGELEAIYSLAKIGEADVKTGSGSALTDRGENSPPDVSLNPTPFGDPDHGAAIVGATAAAAAATATTTDEEAASIGEEASLVRKLHKKKRKKKTKERLVSSMSCFFERLVEQVMGHQDRLHSNFLEAIERLDRERREREEAWRRQETRMHNREAIARVHEQALATSREVLMVSYIEKITGQRVELPSRKTLEPLMLRADLINEISLEETTPIDTFDTNRRWPRSEVEALIRVRSSLEVKFQEPGLKGPIWEEVSALMASMGYKRSAKRCKEKWENINKYFRKTKSNNASKGSQQSKTCSYFDQLAQLYSRTPHNNGASSSSSSYKQTIVHESFGAQGQSYLELLEAFTASRDVVGVTQHQSSANFDLSEMGSRRSDFDGNIFHDKAEFEREKHDEEKVNHRDDEDNDDEIEEEEDVDEEEED